MCAKAKSSKPQGKGELAFFDEYARTSPYAGMEAVIYARYSSHNQRDVSIEQQIALAKDWAKRNGAKVVGVYHDHAKTGTNDRRPDFQRMVRDCETATWQLVITYDTMRFARNRYDSAVYKRTLADNGVRVVYTTVEIADSPEGILLESHLEGYAEYQSAKLSVDVSRGLYDNAKDCLVNGGVMPFGYQKGPDGRYQLHPTNSAIVREIFELYDEGLSSTKVCEILNNRGVLTGKKTKWNKNSLRHMLQNERYLGVYTYGDVKIEGGMPQIIPLELFESVQKKVKKMRETPAANRSDVDYCLTGKLFCGHCGAPMVGASGKGKAGSKYTYYACNNQRRHKCIKKPVKKEWIEKWIVRQTVQVVLQDDVIDKLATAAIELQEREYNSVMLQSLRQQMAEVEKGINNILDAMEQGIITPRTKERLEDLEARQFDLQSAIQEAEIEQPKVTKQQLVAWMQQFKNGDVNDKAFQLSIIETFVHSVYLFDDHGKIVYNYSGKDNTIEFEMIKDLPGEAIPFPKCSALALNAPPK